MKTKNLPLIIGIALPVFFILIISIIVFIPTWFIKPQYNFLYSNQGSYYNYNNQAYSNTYVVDGSSLSLNPPPVSTGSLPKTATNPPLFLYNVKDNSTHQIDFNDAKNFVLDPGPSSPDGYLVKYQYSNEGLFGLFGSNGNQSGYVIAKGNASKSLDGLNASSENYYSNDFKFIGWVK
jgi:hypothetical protein